jgi:hypothetical protein
MSRRHAFYKAVAITLGTNIVRKELGVPEARIPAADERYSLVVPAKCPRSGHPGRAEGAIRDADSCLLKQPGSRVRSASPSGPRSARPEGMLRVEPVLGPAEGRTRGPRPGHESVRCCKLNA